MEDQRGNKLPMIGVGFVVIALLLGIKIKSTLHFEN